MSDLIRRSDALSMLADIKVPDNDDSSMGVVGQCAGVLMFISAVDAVEVVRCKDCKYAMLLRKPEGKLIADCWIRKMNSEDEQFCMVSGDDFCSYGERREDK